MIIFYKNLFIFIVFSTAASLHASDTLGLCDVPWTDASHFWSMDGRRLPVKNKNLMGKQLSIGGIKYDKGLAGHTGFSVAYNLSGEALKFTSVIGIDDGEHKRDPENKGGSFVKIIILVDRKEVFRKTVAWKEKGIPVSIDLRGKQQLELRGEYGKSGFYRQRPVFANPKLEVKNKATFLKQAENWQQKVENEKRISPDYPLAPNWQQISIEKKSYQGWGNSYWVSNGKVELIVSPEFGGRIMSLKLKDGPNILTENGKINKNKLMIRGLNVNAGGHFNRPQPRNYFNPSEPILLFGKYNIEFPAEGEIVMTSQKSWLFWLQWQYKIKISTQKAELEVTNSHKNIAPFPNNIGVWSITRIKPNLVTAIMMAEQTDNPYRKAMFTPESFQSFVSNKGAWKCLDISNSFWAKFGKRTSVEWQCFPTINQIKTVLKDHLFEKTFDYKKCDKNNMGNLYPAHVYVNKKFIEIECHGPTKMLAPGQKIELKEMWRLE